MKAPRFSISATAKDKILSLVKTCQQRAGHEDIIPAICWVDSELNDGEIESQPGIGFYYDRGEVEDDITSVDGLEIVLALTTHDELRFHGKTLDYELGRFVLR